MQKICKIYLIKFILAYLGFHTFKILLFQENNNEHDNNNICIQLLTILLQNPNFIALYAWAETSNFTIIFTLSYTSSWVYVVTVCVHFVMV